MNQAETVADIINNALDAARNIWLDDASVAINALTEAGFVIVACPPGGRVVVSRESKPCAACAGEGSMWAVDEFCGVVEQCSACGGSGVVEATTTYGREQLLGLIEDFVDRDDCRFDHHGYCQAHAWFETDPACPHARAKSILAAVALPEETPQ